MKHGILLLNFFFCLSLLAQNKQTGIIDNITIIPTHLSQSFDNRDVLIEDGKISMIREHLATDSTVYDFRIDGTGKYLIAGMVDAHAHFPSEEDIETYFMMNLINGITTLRSMRGEEWHLKLKEKTTIHPNLILGAPPFRRSDSISIAEREKLVKKYKEEGYDFLKILSLPDSSSFTELVRSSKKHSINVAGHCSSPISYQKAIDSKVYESIEHLHGISRLRSLDEIIATTNACVENEVAFAPTTDWYVRTPFSEETLRKKEGIQYMSKAKILEWENDLSSRYDTLSDEQKKTMMERIDRNYSYRTRLTSFSYRQGVTLLVGADLEGAYKVPGFGYIDELKHFKEAGLSNHDILKAACYNMAIARKEENQWGTIRIGALADLVILSQNPLSNIEHLNSVEGIILNGTFHSREELAKRLDSLPKLN